MTPTTTSPQADPATAGRLSELLDAELAYDPVARGGFINHTAMALVASWRLGATATDLEDLYQGDVTSRFLVGRDEPDGLRAARGEVDRLGVEAAVRRAAPALVASPASQFFHAPIRLEYGLDVAHPAQVANALHNWATHDDGLGDLPAGHGTRPFTEVARELVASPEMGAVRKAGLDDVASAPWFAAALAEVDLAGAGLLDEVAEVVAAAHVAGDNFGTLHLVTGTRAVRAIAPILDGADARRLAAHTAQAVAAGLPTAKGHLPDRAELDGLRATTVPPWDDVARAAIDTGDHHVVKLAYTCRLEQEATGDPLYRWLAARQAGLT